jgi:dipeptidyl aminopeptidase/acylaminoacyl peptidase
MISGLVWLPGGRVIFAASRAVFAEAVLESDLWVVRVEPTGRPEGDPAQLTDWSGFMIENLSASADGKRLIYLRSQLQTDAYVADIEDGGRRIHAPRRLTPGQQNDMPLDWMPDGKSVVFVSDRLGRLLAFRQNIDGDVAEPLTTGRLMSGNPRVTADGKWILYIAAERGARKGPPMRMPVRGGAPQRVLDSVTAEAQYRCSISGPCIFSDLDEVRRERVTWQFDPIAGKGRELFRTRAEDGPADISCGGRIAYLVYGRPRNRIRIVSIDGAEDRMITVAGATSLNSLDWAADGRGLYTGDSVPGVSRLIYAGLDGEQRILWDQAGSWQTWAVPSRGGERIAILGMTRETDAWMIDGI